MTSKKILATLLIGASSLATIPSLFAATDGDFRLLRSDVEQQVQMALSRYEATMAALLNENRALKAELTKLYANPSIKVSMMRQNIVQRTDLLGASISSSGVILLPGSTTLDTPTSIVATGSTTANSGTTNTPATTTNQPTQITVSPIITGESLYNAIIIKTLNQQEAIKIAHGIDLKLTISGYEFVAKKAVFVDFHTSGNSQSSGPFQAKILYAINANGDIDLIKPLGVFVYDASMGKYVTKSGVNSYPSAADRTIFAMPNSSHASTSSNTTGTTSSSTVSTPAVSTKTLDQIDNEIREYYNNNAKNKTNVAKEVWSKLMSLSNEYIGIDATSLEPYRYRYRAYYMLGDYNKALADITRITDVVDSSVADNQPFFCNAYKIAQASGNTSAQAKLRSITDKLSCK
ncbi:MAG: hypothetical protein U0518_03015 [Candidatus Gracilibacteria bacterium]